MTSKSVLTYSCTKHLGKHIYNIHVENIVYFMIDNDVVQF